MGTLPVKHVKGKDLGIMLLEICFLGRFFCLLIWGGCNRSGLFKIFFEASIHVLKKFKSNKDKMGHIFAALKQNIIFAYFEFHIFPF